MRPRFRLDIAGSDVTAAVSDRVVSIKVNDQAGQKSDTLDVVLDDRDGEGADGGVFGKEKEGGISLWLIFGWPV